MIYFRISLLMMNFLLTLLNIAVGHFYLAIFTGLVTLLLFLVIYNDLLENKVKIERDLDKND
jgi:hypothetical protein